MNRNYSDVDKKIERILKCKEIEVKEVGNVMTGNREVRLISWGAPHVLLYNCIFICSTS